MNTRKLFLIIFNGYLMIWCLLWATVFLSPCILWWFLSARNKTRLNSYLWKWFSIMVLKYGCFAKIKIIDRRGHGDRDFLFTPQVFISNHQSLLDIPLTLLKFQVPPIMKKQVLYIPVIGIMGWAAGSVIVDRTSRGSRKQVLLKCKKRLMEEKFTLHYYPEGTRNRESDRPKEFEKIKTPLIRLAFQSQVPVNPVSLCGTQKINRKGGLFYPGQKIGMLLSEPIDPKNFSDEEAFAKACWNQVQTGYDELKNIIS